MPYLISTQSRPRIVIVGAGFAGLAAAKGLAKAPADVVVIDRQNYHLFQPLLYQVATAALSPADIASPIRQILAPQTNARVVLAEVSGVDLSRRAIIVGGRPIPFDKLIIATGARHAYFGHDEWEAHAPGLKRIDDAIALRSRILLAFEKAETEEDDEERRRLLTFVVVGAGPTGVEMAGAIADLAPKALAAEFRIINPREARIVLIEAGPRLLPSFSASSSSAARRALGKLGVEVRLNSSVTSCDADGVIAGGERIEARTIVWAAGVMASKVGSWLDARTDRAGRVFVGADLTVPCDPDVYVIGDAANVMSPEGGPLPGTAPVAKQQGAYVAAKIHAELQGKTMTPFRYRDFGSLATIGRNKAIVEFGRLRLTGFLAWILWCVAHVYFLIGFRNRFSVALNWVWSYLSFQRGARLITGFTASPPEAVAAASAAVATAVRTVRDAA
jgi:NADH:ubiquinone reductase (H+-translocating)